jgi:hypothetical protein
MYLDIDQNKAYAYTARSHSTLRNRASCLSMVWSMTTVCGICRAGIALSRLECARRGLPAHGRSEGPPLGNVEAMAAANQLDAPLLQKWRWSVTAWVH